MILLAKARGVLYVRRAFLVSVATTSVFGFANNKERQRYYLLPGMGGRAARRKHTLMLRWAIAAGLLVSAALAVALYFTNNAWR